ncbi:MAG: hypothetical protein MI753_11540 [Hyphomicrobiales bacterium]|nr:hypothetical protein [Hyphomicrobiales bacterium]
MKSASKGPELQGLEKFSLPVRCGIFGFLGGCIGAVLADGLGFMEGRSAHAAIPVAAAG